MFVQVIGAALLITFGCNGQRLNQQSFPKDFLFGTATAALQVEGAWDLDGKGENEWDWWAHNFPNKIKNGDNADVACDSYHKYKEDVQLLKSLNVNFYRFSISWSRILPTGSINQINAAGLRYYNLLIDELLNNGIQPMVTIFHFDLPVNIMKMGGWSNDAVINVYVDYARLVFRQFGPKVKKWITINEPKNFCRFGYGDSVFPPGLNRSGIADYLCVKNALLAHAQVARMYKKEFKGQQKGEIGITLDSNWFQPATNKTEDIAAADRMLDFYLGIFANPIFGTGDFPAVVKKNVAYRSKKQGFMRSRLPGLSKAEILRIKGSADFLGLNYYTASLVADTPEDSVDVISWDSDMQVFYWQSPYWPPGASSWMRIVPWGIRKLLAKVKSKYNNIPVYITENGYSDAGGLKDTIRANYIMSHLSNLLESIYTDKVNLKGYTYWSLVDNFEWMDGYSVKFGLTYVDFNDNNRKRTRKYSYQVYNNIIKTRKLKANLDDAPGWNIEVNEPQGPFYPKFSKSYALATNLVHGSNYL